MSFSSIRMTFFGVEDVDCTPAVLFTPYDFNRLCRRSPSESAPSHSNTRPGGAGTKVERAVGPLSGRRRESLPRCASCCARRSGQCHPWHWRSPDCESPLDFRFRLAPGGLKAASLLPTLPDIDPTTHFLCFLSKISGLRDYSSSSIWVTGAETHI